MQTHLVGAEQQQGLVELQQLLEDGDLAHVERVQARGFLKVERASFQVPQLRTCKVQWW